MMPVHGGECPNKCVLCHKSLNDEGHLKWQQHIHSGELPCHCDVCTESFSFLSFLKTFPTIYWDLAAAVPNDMLTPFITATLS